MRSVLLLFFLLFGTFIYAQRVVLPDQELLYPFLNDPSFIGEGQRVQLTGLLQLSDSDFQHTTKWLNAQVSLYDNVAFGLDYYNDSFDFYDYSTIMFTTAFKVGLGDYNHHIKIGLAGGGESRKQDSRPLITIPPGQDYVADVTNNNIDFIYKAGIHYTNMNITIGGYYNSLPVQNITFENLNQLMHYNIEDGFTAYALYNWRVADKVRITPMVRYLSYLEDAIYEGAVKMNYADRVEASIAYRNDYSINPAVRVRVIKALDIGYSYEKALGATDFQDVHGISASYKFFKADEEEPEWLRNAKDNIEEVSEIRKQKRKDNKAEKARTREEKRKAEQTEEGISDETPVKEEEIKQVENEEPKPAEPRKVEPTKIPEEKKEETKDEQPAVKEPEAEQKKVEKPIVEEAEEAPAEAPQDEEDERVKEVVTPKAKPTTSAETGLLEKGFYIVVGSFESEAQAAVYMKRIDSDIYFPRMGRKEANGPLHVYIDSDSNREEAGKRLRAHKLDRNFRNARLLEVQ